MEKEKQIEEMAKEYGEVKKKIIDILTETLRWEPYYFISRGIIYENDLPKIADALIEAGIGDMKEAKHRAEVAERALKNACVRLNSDDGILCSFEMGYGWFCPHIKTSCEECYVEWFIEQAEKELSEG